MVNSLMVALAMAIPPIRRLKEQRDRFSIERDQLLMLLQNELAARSAQAPVPTAAVEQANQPALERLPGTPYSRYALPVDYQPSRDMRPRWGGSRPKEPILDQWFSANAPTYFEFLTKMRAAAPALANIPVEFDEANLPLPAWNGVPYCPFDGLALYTMIKEHRPKRYLEIGSGITTCFAHRAVKDNGLTTTITSIDPEPRAKIDSICDHVIRDGLETCDLSIFDELEAGDILFFDGSHRVFMNSDVTVFFIDVLPRIRPGVIIHIHDITLPFDYPDMFIPWYWSEQYILAVYLMNNRQRIDPLLPTAYVCKDDQFRAALATPMIDLGPYNDGWSGGGAMWFTHTSPLLFPWPGKTGT